MEAYQGAGWEYREALAKYVKDVFNVECIWHRLFKGSIFRPRYTDNYHLHVTLKDKETIGFYVHDNNVEEDSLIGVIKSLRRWNLIQDQSGSI